MMSKLPEKLRLKNRGNDNHNDVTCLTQIHKARLKKNLSIADVCRLTGLSYDNYIKYEKGIVKEQYMCIETLQKLSCVLDIDIISPYNKFKINAQSIVRDYMADNNLSISKFADICSVSTTTVKHWRNGICSPSYEIWERYFK